MIGAAGGPDEAPPGAVTVVHNSPERRAAASGSYVVALILAVGMGMALNLLVLAIVWDAIVSAQSGISENATQILTGWGGGVLGVIGAVVGYQAGASSTQRRDGTP